MANNYFRFKEFTVEQGESAFKVTTDSVLLGAWADLKGADRILDIGTGTGLLALMAAQRSEAEIVAIEPDTESFLQANANISASKWASRITLINSTIQSLSSENSGRFDIIITNPPYFTGSLLNPDPRKAAARHSFSLSPEDLLNAVNELLAEDGKLMLVLPYKEGRIFLTEASLQGLHCHRILNVRPSPSSEVKRILLSLGRKECRPEEAEIIIETGGRHKYSEEYIALTRDFYLKM